MTCFQVDRRLTAAELLEKLRVLQPSHLLEGASRYVSVTDSNHKYLIIHSKKLISYSADKRCSLTPPLTVSLWRPAPKMSRFSVFSFINPLNLYLRLLLQ